MYALFNSLQCFVSFNHINITQEIFTIIILLFIISLKHSPHSRHFGKRESGGLKLRSAIGQYHARL